MKFDKRLIRRIAIGVLLSVVFFFWMVIYGLRLMDIEDHYGELEELYWKAEDGDIIVNKITSQAGIVELDWHRIYVKKGEAVFDIGNWLGFYSKNKFNVAIYRPKTEISTADDLKISEIQSHFQLITEINIDYPPIVY